MVIHINNSKKRKTQRKIKTHWAKSWRDVPYSGLNSTLGGYADPKRREIFAIKGRTSKADVLHEEFHIKKQHPTRPNNYKDYISQEIDATYYAYKKIGEPKHILQKLRAIFNDVAQNDYTINPHKTIQSIKSYLFSLDIPNTWEEDFNKMQREFNGIYR